MPAPVTTGARPTGRAIRIGLLLFAVGVVAVVVDVIPFFFGNDDRPLWLYLVCLLVPVGLVVTIWSAVARGRREQRAAARAVAELRTPAA